MSTWPKILKKVRSACLSVNSPAPELTARFTPKGRVRLGIGLWLRLGLGLESGLGLVLALDLTWIIWERMN